MLADEDRATFKLGGSDVPKLQWFAVANVQLEHLVEIAIKQISFMTHAER